MAKSFGGAIMEGVPVIMMGGKGKVPEVMCRANKKAEALDMLEKMGLITIAIVPDEPRVYKNGDFRVM